MLMTKRLSSLVLSLFLLHLYPCMAQDISNASYPFDPASQQHPGVPKGEVLQFTFDHSSIYPGTRRKYWIYVPAQYKPEQPACLFVCMDGIQFNATTVFDNLIHDKEMPVTIGVFIESGVVMKDDTTVLRYNRSNEFDDMSDRFDRFLLDELLPDVESRKTSDGRPIRLSGKANDRAIAGASSGAICAFTAAWLRPDAFSRVFSAIGTYVGMRGGDAYPVLIRKTEPKPIRIFLQDGAKDSWNPLFGNWYLNNQSMEAALSFAGYEVNHAWGQGGHDGVQATAIFPDVMRWLWKGWPSPVKAGLSGNDFLKKILVPGETWTSVATDARAATCLAAAPGGDIFFSDSLHHEIYKISSGGKTNLFAPINGRGVSLACDPDGALYVLDDGKEMVRYDVKGKGAVLQKKLQASSLLVSGNHNVYITGRDQRYNDDGRLWLIRRDGTKTLVDENLDHPEALALSSDQSALFVAEKYSHWIESYIVQPDGTLRFRQRWCWLHAPENSSGEMGTLSMCVDDQGNLYVATGMGIQVCDQNGRVRAILPLPGGPVSGLCFGGEHFDTLFAICGGQIFRRRLNVHGVPAWGRPVHPASIGAG